MRRLATYLRLRELERSQWLPPARQRAGQLRRLRRLLAEAREHVPFQRERLAAAGLVPERMRSLEELARIPVASKADYQAAGERAWSRAYRPEDCLRERTSGSAGRPLELLLDPAFLRARTALLLRTLRAAGHGLRARVLLVVRGDPEAVRPALPWRYAAIDADAERLCAELERFRPEVVYGCVSPLRRMALALLECGRPAPPVRTVVTTAESLPPGTRRLLERAFGARVHDSYAATELGVAGLQCRSEGPLHLAEDAAVFELLPSESEPDAHRLVVTSLELRATPIVRLELGDRVARSRRGACACGRHGLQVERVAGRTLDDLRRPDGRALSAYAVTGRIEVLPGIERYRVLQESARGYRVELLGAGGARLHERVRTTLRELLGPEAEVRVEVRSELEPAPGRKFRVVENRAFPPTPAVEGAA